MNNDNRFHYLLLGYIQGTLSGTDQAELFEMLASGLYDQALNELILLDLNEGSGDQQADLPPHISEEIIRNIFRSENYTAAIIAPKRHHRMFWWMAAAGFAALICILLYLVLPRQKGNHSLATLIPDSTFFLLNNSAHPRLLTLPDGSRVTLHSRSSIYYPKEFAANKREVYLTGEAFFEITKNAQQPFLVYCNNVVTRVLGTSFMINTNQVTGNVEIAVKTGTVQVYENDKLLDGINNDNAVIVTPNQKAIYTESSRMFQKTLVEKPEPLKAYDVPVGNLFTQGKKPFVYDHEKLLSIFEQLYKTYGIEIVLENSNLNNCLFTGDISDNNLFNKLKIICLTVNASYEINGTAILIKGDGCNE